VATARGPTAADRVKRWGYRLALAGLHVWWALAHPRSRGVRCVILRGDRVLLVKQTYGDRSSWVIPGGRVKRSESPIDAARREMSEELGLELVGPRVVGRFLERGGGRRETLFCVLAEAGAGSPQLNLAELRDAGWFHFAGLPEEADWRTRRLTEVALREHVRRAGGGRGRPRQRPSGRG
jgi:8-oxo-dGTP pyrophosphatase MutT (NUDIX family)